MAEKTVIEINSGGRKARTRNPTPRKQYIDQDPLGLKFTIPCRHKSEKTKFRCSKIPTKIILANRKKFFVSTAKVQQDLFLSRLTSPYEPERRNKIPLKGTKVRTLSCSYHLLAKNKKAVPVCKRFFMATFNVSEKRLRNLNKTIHKGLVPKENRGGDHRSHKTTEKKNKLREFLNNLPAKESHYNRSKSKRIYLSSQLNATKLLKLFNDSVTIDYKIKPGKFYKIFHGEYNIGFSTPASDVCSTCTLLTNKIKVEQDPSKKVELMTQKRVHKLRANSFYEIMKSEVPSSMSLCFDLQQVLPLPRTPIGESFYCRQVSLYNFCIVDPDKNKPFFYVWNETQANRGSVEIGSALYSYLSSLTISDEIQILRLFCDGCGGQNKNSHIIHTLLQWLYAKAPPTLKCIQITYPVRGHSFLPADRVFGRIEKDLRKTPIITTKEEYFDIIKRHGKLQELTTKWKNIKDKFRKCLNENNSSKSGDPAKKKQKYVYFDILQFLLPVMKERPISGNISGDENLTPTTVDSVENNTSDSDHYHRIRQRPTRTSNIQNVDTALQSDSSTKLLELLKERNDRELEDMRDEDTLFLLSLVPSLKKLSPLMKMRTKIEIMTAIENNSYVDRSNYTNSSPSYGYNTSSTNVVVPSTSRQVHSALSTVITVPIIIPTIYFTFDRSNSNQLVLCQCIKDTMFCNNRF